MSQDEMNALLAIFMLVFTAGVWGAAIALRMAVAQWIFGPLTLGFCLVLATQVTGAL